MSKRTVPFENFQRLPLPRGESPRHQHTPTRRRRGRKCLVLVICVRVDVYVGISVGLRIGIALGGANPRHDPRKLTTRILQARAGPAELERKLASDDDAGCRLVNFLREREVGRAGG